MSVARFVITRFLNHLLLQFYKMTQKLLLCLRLCSELNLFLDSLRCYDMYIKKCCDDVFESLLKNASNKKTLFT